MTTDRQLQAQVSALQQDVKKLHALLRSVADKVGVVADAAPKHVVGDDGRVFVPSTGWTGSTAPSTGAPLERDEALAVVRELRASRTT